MAIHLDDLETQGKQKEFILKIEQLAKDKNKTEILHQLTALLPLTNTFKQSLFINSIFILNNYNLLHIVLENSSPKLQIGLSTIEKSAFGEKLLFLKAEHFQKIQKFDEAIKIYSKLIFQESYYANLSIFGLIKDKLYDKGSNFDLANFYSKLTPTYQRKIFEGVYYEKFTDNPQDGIKFFIKHKKQSFREAIAYWTPYQKFQFAKHLNESQVKELYMNLTPDLLIQIIEFNDNISPELKDRLYIKILKMHKPTSSLIAKFDQVTFLRPKTALEALKIVSLYYLPKHQDAFLTATLFMGNALINTCEFKEKSEIKNLIKAYLTIHKARADKEYTYNSYAKPLNRSEIQHWYQVEDKFKDHMIDSKELFTESEWKQIEQDLEAADIYL